MLLRRKSEKVRWCSVALMMPVHSLEISRLLERLGCQPAAGIPGQQRREEVSDVLCKS